MAKIIKINGTQIEVEPKNGKDFKLDELKAIVRGWIEIVFLPNDRLMVVNEEGKPLGLPVNEQATRIYTDAFGYHDEIVGDVLICDRNQIE